MTRLLALVLTPILALTLAACGHRASQHAQTSPIAPQPTLASSEQPPAQTTEAAPPASQSETEQAASAQESSGDNAEEDRGPDKSDLSLEHLAALPPEAQLPSGKWKPGTHYDPLVPAQPTNVAPGKVEVVEVFWLGCPHCYALEPFIQSWLKSKPSYIEFVRVPVMWGPVHRAHAKLYYTLMALNRGDLFEKAFDNIQQQRQMVAATDADTLKLQEAWAKEQGISNEDFEKAYNSFGVDSNLKRAEQLTQRYHVDGVPLVVINGKYTTDVGKAGSPAQLISLIDDLSATEHTAKGRG